MDERNRRHFLRNLPDPGRQEVLQRLKQRYQLVLKRYFGQADSAEEALEHFVSTAFSADVPAQLLVKIHIQIMDSVGQPTKNGGAQRHVPEGLPSCPH